MLIVNADDWGRSTAETDAALDCHRAGRVKSVSAMVFMQDSERAAALAREHGVDVGLHLNLDEQYNGRAPGLAAAVEHRKVVRFMTWSKYALLLYHPGLRRAFHDVFQSQWDEFVRLYGTTPSHIDSHHHRHTCLNCILHPVIFHGHQVRRNFTFRPDEKTALNRAYRHFIDRRLARWYKLTDYFFTLERCLHDKRVPFVVKLAEKTNVELETHPVEAAERDYLLSEDFRSVTAANPPRSFTELLASRPSYAAPV